MSIVVDGLSKRYGANTVVSAVSLDVPKGELFVLLGPSGSGKSTLLRMIAGLTEPDSGRVFLHDQDVTATSPKDRGIGFVFQHYALFRNLTVADNIEFSLRVRGQHAAQRRQRREELLAMIGLSGLGHRFPSQLSGGQRQRVALARALAHRPPVLLLDEPFGALDAKIRVELRQTLRRIQHEMGFTAIFVTHDQEEAFELGDRVGVMHMGRLLEVGAPGDLYLRPRSAFVATFLGVANLLVGESTPDSVRLGDVDLRLGTETGRVAPPRVQVLFRPEDIALARSADGLRSTVLGRGVVEERSFAGAWERLRIRMQVPPRVRQIAPIPSFGDGVLRLEVARPQPDAMREPLAVGGEAWVGLHRAHVLAPVRIDLRVLEGSEPGHEIAREYATRLAQHLGGRIRPFPDPPPALAEDRTAPGRMAAAAEVESLDILTVGFDGAGRLPREALAADEPSHLLVVPASSKIPSRILVCVKVGEPGKVDVRVAERLAWRLQAEVSVLTVLPEKGSVPEHVERFLDASVRDLRSRGTEVRARVRFGTFATEILAEADEAGHGLLIVGAPVQPAGHSSRQLGGVVGRLLEAAPCPILVVHGASD